MSTVSIRSAGSSSAAPVLRSILEEISVPLDVLKEARARRDLVLSIAAGHLAARARYSSGSVAYGTTNSPLEDADGGIKINRRLHDLREFGPDAPSGGLRPEGLMEHFGLYVVERLRRRGYPNATVDFTGNRAVKFYFHAPVRDRQVRGDRPVRRFHCRPRPHARASGLWIPNCELESGWDVADPEHHLEVMNRRPSPELRVHRAHVIRLAKRAVKRDQIVVMCSWNISALAVELITDTELPLPEALAAFFAGAAKDIARRLTPDPSPVVDPIDLPDGITQIVTATRLAEMAEHALEAATARSEAGARAAYAKLYGPEIDAIRERLARSADRRLAAGMSLAPAVSAAHKATRSDGA